jgi:Zn-dependent protease with chaperone function
MLDGRYFYPNAARFVAARAAAAEKRLLRVEDESGAVLAQVPAKRVRVSARLARLTRRFDLPDGGIFETDDNDGADLLLRALRKRRRGGFTDRLERAWPAVGLSLVVTLVVGAYFIVQVIPSIAEWLAKETLPAVAHTMSEQTLLALDRFALKPTKLKAADQFRATKLFMRVAAHAHGGIGAYRLVFRAGAIGPNAFALPDGTIVMTDDLWPLIKNDEEIEGVFAHEMSHVDHAHGLQRVYEASLFPAPLAIFTGDVSQISQMAAILPGVIAQSAYSRSFEQQADDDAAATLRSMGEKPSHMADLLERLDKKMCAGKTCPPSWIGDHPNTVERAARLRAEDRGAISPVADCVTSWTNRLSFLCLGIVRN